jgi:hypothetical protein
MIKLLLSFLLLPFYFEDKPEKVFQDGNMQSHPSDIEVLDLIKKIYVANDNIRTLRFTFISSERINGKLTSTKSLIKFQASPKRIYLNCKQAEILWLEDKNSNQALVHPHGFPYFNLNLDPDHSLLRKGQHHSVRHIGFDYLISIIKANSKAVMENRTFLYNGEEKMNERFCYKITAFNQDFAFIDYKVKRGETMISIARKLHVSEYMIHENNQQYGSYSDIRENDVIKVPTAYSKMTVLYIDKEFQLPIAIRVYDDKGLFESFEYNSLQVNTPIAYEEFSKNYKDYNF